MKNKVPVKRLVRLNWIMAIVISGFVGLFLFTLLGINSQTLFIVLQGAFDFLAVGSFHIFVLLKLG